MDFRTFFLGLPVPERDAYAGRAGTSRGLLTQVAYGNKEVELGFADVLVKLAQDVTGPGGDALTLDDLPLTKHARRQRAIREGRTLPPVEDVAESKAA